MNYGKALEDMVEQTLIHHGVPYKRENVARFGRRASKGKYDFEVLTEPKVCFDCKSVATNTNLTMPPMKTPKVKTHQLRALRQEQERGHRAGLVIEYRHIEAVYWLDIDGLNALHQEYGMVSAITPLHCDRFGQRLEVVDGVIKGLMEVPNDQN